MPSASLGGAWQSQSGRSWGWVWTAFCDALFPWSSYLEMLATIFHFTGRAWLRNLPLQKGQSQRAEGGAGGALGDGVGAPGPWLWLELEAGAVSGLCSTWTSSQLELGFFDLQMQEPQLIVIWLWWFIIERQIQWPLRTLRLWFWDADLSRPESMYLSWWVSSFWLSWCQDP